VAGPELAWRCWPAKWNERWEAGTMTRAVLVGAASFRT